MDAKVLQLTEQLKLAKAENTTTKQMFNAQSAQMTSYMQQLERMQMALISFQTQPGGPNSPSVQQLLPPADPTSPQLTRPPTVPKRRDPLAPFGQPQDSKKMRKEESTEVIPDSPPPQGAQHVTGMD